MVGIKSTGEEKEPEGRERVNEEEEDKQAGAIEVSKGEEEGDTKKEEAEVESVYSQSKYWLIDHSKTSKLNKQFLRCTQTFNLRNNFLYWDAKSKEKQTITTPSANHSLDIADGNGEPQPSNSEPQREVK